MDLDLDIFAVDSSLLSPSIGKVDQGEVDNVPDIFSMTSQDDGILATGVGNQNGLSGTSDMDPFFNLDDKGNNVAGQKMKSQDVGDMIDIFAIENDQLESSQGIKYIDFKDGKLSKGNRESVGSFEHYNVDFISYLSDDCENNVNNLESDQPEVQNLAPHQVVPKVMVQEVLDSTLTSDDTETEEDVSFQIHDDIDEDGPSSILETTDASRSDSESSESYTVAGDDYYNGSDTSTTIESSDVEEEEVEVEKVEVEVEQKTAEQILEGDSGVKEDQQEDDDGSSTETEDDREWWQKDDVVVMLFPGDTMRIRSKMLQQYIEKFKMLLCIIEIFDKGVLISTDAL